MNETGVTWVGFCALGSLSSTALHFMPLAGENISPIDVFCSIKLFALEDGLQEIQFEGLRIAEPNGLQLNTLFPEAKPLHGEFCGFELSLYSERPDQDLTTSECIVEMRSSHGSLMYRPRHTCGDDAPKEMRALIYEAHLRNQRISIIAANPHAETALTNFEQQLGEFDEDLVDEDLLTSMLREIPAGGLEEIELLESDEVYNEDADARAGVFVVSQKLSRAEENVFSHAALRIKHLEHPIPMYALYRDKVSGKACMVVEL